MKTQFISLLIALLAGLLPLQAQQVSISGIVTDKKTERAYHRSFSSS